MRFSLHKTKFSKKKYAIAFLLLFAVLLISNHLLAQCAMCKASAEADLKNGSGIGKGLNAGIVYLLFVPYILLAGLAFLFFKKQIIEKFKAIRSRFLFR